MDRSFLAFAVGHVSFAVGAYAVAGIPALLMFEGATFMAVSFYAHFYPERLATRGLLTDAG